MSRYGMNGTSSSSSSKSSRTRRAGGKKKRKSSRSAREKGSGKGKSKSRSKRRTKKRSRVLRPPKPPKAKRWVKAKKKEPDLSWVTHARYEASIKPEKSPKKRQVRKARLPDYELRCGVCGAPGDHDGDGHPYEKWDDEPQKMKVTPRAPSKFAVHQVLGQIKNDRDVLK